MIKFRHFAKISSNIFHIICQNLIRQFLKVTFNEIFCKLALLLFYITPAEYIASGLLVTGNGYFGLSVGWKQNLTTDSGWDSVRWFSTDSASVAPNGWWKFLKILWFCGAMLQLHSYQRFDRTSFSFLGHCVRQPLLYTIILKLSWLCFFR